MLSLILRKLTLIVFISKEGMRNSTCCYQLAECCIWNYEKQLAVRVQKKITPPKKTGLKWLICKYNNINLNTLYFWLNWKSEDGARICGSSRGPIMRLSSIFFLQFLISTCLLHFLCFSSNLDSTFHVLAFVMVFQLINMISLSYVQ